MKVLIACEYSGIVRDAFVRAGHDAISCDLIKTDRPNWTYDPHTSLRTHHPDRGGHYQGDVRDILDNGWDLMIAHPPCTYLCSSGLHWNKRTEGRQALTDEALDFVRLLLNAPIMGRTKHHHQPTDGKFAVQPTKA